MFINHEKVLRVHWINDDVCEMMKSSRSSNRSGQFVGFGRFPLAPPSTVNFHMKSPRYYLASFRLRHCSRICRRTPSSILD